MDPSARNRLLGTGVTGPILQHHEMGGVRTRTLKSELRLARLTVVVSLSVPYAFRQLCIADVSPADLSCISSFGGSIPLRLPSDWIGVCRCWWWCTAARAVH
jgi:hypothetical protein